MLNSAAARLPAIVGGDFNYDLQKYQWDLDSANDQDLRRIQMLDPITRYFLVEGRSPNREIDYLCTVCATQFPTKLLLDPPQTYNLHDIARRVTGRDINPDEITNHWPYAGRIRLWTTL